MTNPLLLLTIILQIFLGSYVLFKGKQKKSKISLVGLCFSIAIWALCLYIASFIEPGTITTLSRFTFLGPTLLMLSNLMFSIYFPDDTPRIKKTWIYFLPTIAILLLLPTPLIISSSTKTVDGLYDLNRNIGIHAFNLYMLSYLVLAFYGYYIKYRTADHLSRNRIKYLYLGVSITAISGFITNLILPMFGYIELANTGPVYSLVLVSFAAYALLKKDLLNVAGFIRRGFIYSIFLILFIGYSIHIHINKLSSSDFISSTMIFSLILGGMLYYYSKHEHRVELEEYEQQKAINETQLNYQSLMGNLKQTLTQQAHDIKNPLLSISSCAKELAKYIPMDNQDAIECLEDLHDGFCDAETTINNLLDMIRNSINIEETKQPISLLDDIEPYTINEVISSVNNSFKKTINRLNIDVRHEDVDSTIQIAHIERTYFESWIKNIYTNAIRELEKVKVRQLVLYTTMLDNNYFELHIWNNGSFISEEKIKQIFNPGVSFSGSSGVGLSSIKQAIERPPVNGSITAISVKTEGTTFVLKLKKRT